jgi:sugar phosphate isomerase/epimerase
MSSVGMTILTRRSLVRIGLLSLLLAVSPGARAAGPDDPLGWRCGPAAWSFNRFTFFEAVDKTAALGLHYIEAFEGQRVSKDSDAKIAADLPDPLVARVREKLASAGVKLTSLYIHTLPGDEALARKAFELCRKLGVETIVSEPAPESLNVIEKLCDEFKINVAIHDHPKGQSRYWHPQEVLKVVEGRSPRLGACADIGHWQRSGIRPVDGLKLLGSRLITLHVKDLDKPGPDGHDVPWGTGRGEIAEVLRTVRQLGLRPTLFAIEYEYNWDNNGPDIARCAEFFRQTVAAMAASEAAQERPLTVGWATVDITPPKPVALVGQLHKRISSGVRDPITATALALETRGEKGDKEQAVMVSCDVVGIPRLIQKRLQEKVASRLPDLDARKIFLNATHTHTAPGFIDSQFKGLYDVSHDPGVMKASEYAEVFLERVAEAVVRAWEGRKPGGLSWALSRAVVGFNRRAHYFDGTTKMYGDTATPAFANVEGYEDHAVDLLFLWGADNKLTGLVINLACPSQETEQLHEISADFWHDVREEIHRRHGNELFILPQCAPAGDLSPHLIYRKQAEQVMDLRRGLSRRKDIARRIASAVDDAFPLSRADIKTRLVFRHTVAAADLVEHQPGNVPFYETDPVHPIEFHVLRLGDVAVATNPFELFVDYATRIEARSRAVSTMLVQLSSGVSGYLPTERAVKGGGYSADKFVVGPAGGQVLVEETLKRINELWP